MIYQRNGSLLIEIFGTYGNNEVIAFQRMAAMFGIYYTRYNAINLIEHQRKEFYFTYNEQKDIIYNIREYFIKKSYSHNICGSENGNDGSVWTGGIDFDGSSDRGSGSGSVGDSNKFI